jgi:hypothetical protein
MVDAARTATMQITENKIMKRRLEINCKYRREV